MVISAEDNAKLHKTYTFIFVKNIKTLNLYFNKLKFIAGLFKWYGLPDKPRFYYACR